MRGFRAVGNDANVVLAAGPSQLYIPPSRVAPIDLDWDQQS